MNDYRAKEPSYFFLLLNRKFLLTINDYSIIDFSIGRRLEH